MSNDAVSPLPLLYVAWGGPKTGKSSHLRFLRLERGLKTRDDVNTIDELHLAVRDRVAVIATESREVARAAQKMSALVVAMGDESLWDDVEWIQDAIQPQPPPVAAQGDVWAELIADVYSNNPADTLLPYMEARRQQGIDKYGTPLQRANGRSHLKDALQEALDGMVYARAEEELGIEAAFEEAARLLVMALEGRR